MILGYAKPRFQQERAYGRPDLTFPYEARKWKNRRRNPILVADDGSLHRKTGGRTTHKERTFARKVRS